MLEVYISDIEGFGKVDWEDMLDNPNAPLEMASRYTDWVDDKRVVFRVSRLDSVPQDSGWDECPVGEFAFNLARGGSKVEYSEGLSDLVSDLLYLAGMKRDLYRTRLYDVELDRDMDLVADQFADAYDRASARALLMLLRELYGARGE